jgi:predicted dehydrogenase
MSVIFMSHSSLKVALVGCGLVSGPHLAGWAASRRAQVVAVCDARPEAVRGRAAEFGIPEVFEDFGAMLSAVRPDVVDVCTTLPSHRDLVIAAAEAGCHVFLEKPMADSLEAAGEMVRACRGAGVALMVCQNFRWYAWAQRIQRGIEEGAVGTPHYLSIVERNPNAVPAGPSRTVSILQSQPHYRTPQRLVGFEMALHHIDLARWWTGEPEQVFARMLRVSPHVGGEDVCTLLLSRPGFLGVIEESWASLRSPFRRVVVEGDRGSLIYEGGTITCHTQDDPSSPRMEALRSGLAWEETFALAQAHFLDCLDTGRTPMTSGADNLRNLKIALAGYEADREGRSVPLDG